jgi:multidrug efflux pump subunit AcrB
VHFSAQWLNPVVFLSDVEGQLFSDLALTIAIAVLISFLVAISILPTIASRWLQEDLPEDRLKPLWNKIATSVMNASSTPKRRIILASSLMLIPAIATYLMMPKLDYLPPVKRDAVDAFFNFPAGASDTFVNEEVIKPVVERLQPYMNGEKQPALKNYYVLTWPNGGTIGVRAKDQSKVTELQELVRNEILIDLPDTRTFVMQGNLFGGFGNGRSIEMRLQATDQSALTFAAEQGLEFLRQAFPGSNVRAEPNLQQAEPELRLYPNDTRIAEVGYDRIRIANLVRSMGDGIYVGEYFDGIKRMNIIFRSEKWLDPEELAVTPVMTPNGEMVQLSELVDVVRAVGPSQIQRIDRRRILTLSVNPPDDMSLEVAIQKVKEEVEPKIAALLPADGAINYGGSADSLNSVIATMGKNFLVAMGLLLVLMAGLFRSFKDSLMVVLSIPLATVGGVAAIQILNLVKFQPMDLLTMIGFIILLGLVVNNAILLVHQTRMGEQEGLNRVDAVHQALLLRLRPIFMSTLTSIFGMLPLLLMPGAGSVIYRGLAAVIVGGMVVITLFTLILLPTLLQISGGGVRKNSVLSEHELLESQQQ